jgi:chromosome segregation ATPase
MAEHSADSQRCSLHRELEKHQTALSGISEKIAAIDKEEKRKREEKEAKARDLASLQSQLKACQGWIIFVQKKITEIKETAARHVRAACSGDRNVYLMLGGALQELAIRELELAAFKAYEVSVQVKIEAH